MQHRERKCVDACRVFSSLPGHLGPGRAAALTLTFTIPAVLGFLGLRVFFHGYDRIWDPPQENPAKVTTPWLQGRIGEDFHFLRPSNTPAEVSGTAGSSNVRQDELDCPICMCTIETTDCHVTSCGHLFCNPGANSQTIRAMVQRRLMQFALPGLQAKNASPVPQL